MTTIRQVAGGVSVLVRVRPASRNSAMRGLRNGRLLVDVAAAPEKGRANRELCKVMADCLSVPKSSVEVTSGKGSKNKTVSVRDIHLRAAKSALSKFTNGDV